MEKAYEGSVETDRKSSRKSELVVGCVKCTQNNSNFMRLWTLILVHVVAQILVDQRSLEVSITFFYFDQL